MTARPARVTPSQQGRLQHTGGRSAIASILALLLFFHSLTAGGTPSNTPRVQKDPAPPSSVPPDHYTPHGYIDNPYHSMVFNRSGVLRTFPPMGLGWWRTDFEGSYAEGPRNYVSYHSLLNISIVSDGAPLAIPGAGPAPGAELFSGYHTKNVFSYDLRYDSLQITARYFLAGEDALLCRIEIRNGAGRDRNVTIHATHIYRLGDLKWWGRDGIASRYRTDIDCIVSKGWAYGDVFALGSTGRSRARQFAQLRGDWLRQISSPSPEVSLGASLKGVGPLYSTLSYPLSIPPKGDSTLTLCLSRGRTESGAADELLRGLRSALPSLSTLYADDERFWSGSPSLAGDWPDSWRRGWVYDFETLRMNVRRPLGVFKHPWDGMQVHSPRMVLGETGFDMMTLSYADPALAREVLEGTFADALAPNVPCAREDGSVNMISADGSECGTAPMWGYPFQMIRSIYLRAGDDRWIRNLYPGLKAYLDWWLTNRTDSAGWLHCNNSWESGQDGSRRFLVAEGNEGAVASFVRTVDVEASVAEAMQIMTEFASIAGREGEKSRWSALARRRIENTRSMFIDGWFRDIDGRSNTPIMLPGSPDLMMLTPLTCRVASDDQLRLLGPILDTLAPANNRALQWPPGLYTYCEAAWNAGRRSRASEIVAQVADRVYRRTDSRAVSFADTADPFNYRVPGVANEFWPLRESPPGGENYGWGAILPMFIIRNILGFREQDRPGDPEWQLSPSLPVSLNSPGKRYTIRNLSYRGLRFDATYACGKDDSLTVRLDFRAIPPPLRITDEAGHPVVTKVDGKSVLFAGTNQNLYVVRRKK